MKLKKISDLNYVEIVPVKLRNKSDIILTPFGDKESGNARTAIANSGDYEGEVLLYKAHTEQKYKVSGVVITVIPVNAIISLIDLEEDFIAEPIVMVNKEIHQEGWIDAVQS